VSAQLSPTVATGALLLIAFAGSVYSLVATAGGELVDIPLVAAPLVALYVVARRLGDDVAIGWMVFGAAFIIVVPMVMFALLLSVSSQGGVNPDLGIQFGPLMTVGPVVQIVAVALLYFFARLVRRGPGRS
jgi:hypothetical protein